MKTLVKTRAELIAAGRCDIDYHLPPEHLNFPKDLIVRVDAVADVLKDKRKPAEAPGDEFLYVDISSVEVTIGRVTNPQELLGIEAPSRARKVIREGDIVVSTCRPTRGAIAIIPEHLDNQICSTGFSVVRAKPERVLPEFLHWALRLSSTLEQFRKWSTGSSYPAILDEDVEKTLIPVPSLEIQIEIVADITNGLTQRDEHTSKANRQWERTLEGAKMRLTNLGIDHYDGRDNDPADNSKMSHRGLGNSVGNASSGTGIAPLPSKRKSLTELRRL